MQSKSHLLLLDALRGVAALIVLYYHCFECVIAYAYDDRKSMGFGSFAKRRLIRLHPMVIAGAVIGLVTFLIDGGTNWEGVAASPANLTLAFVLALLMLPVYPGWGADVRGNGEMFPLNGPQWSLFFEYIGNGFCWGLLRMLFPYSLGMLLCRIYMKKRAAKPFDKKYFIPVFVACSATLIALLPMPFVGSPDKPWTNGLYILFLTMIVFPAIIWAAASAGAGESKFCSFIGELSYPLYIVHYPLMYMFYRYHGFPNVTCTMADVWPMAVATFLGSIALAVIFLYAYDKPVRRWLSRKNKVS